MAKTTVDPKERRPVLIEYLDKDGTDGPEPTDEELAFEAFRDEFAESDTYAKITVYRQPTGPANRPGQKKLAFLFECGLDEYTFSQLLSKLRDEYGSGTYRLQARDSNGGLKFNRAVEVEATKKAPTGAPETTTDLLKGFSEMLAASQERTEALIAKFREPAKPGTDPAAMMAQTIALFTSMLGALTPIFQGAKPAGGDFMGELQKFAAVKALLGDLAGGGDGGSAAETNFYDLAGTTLKTIAPVLTAAMSGKIAVPGLNPPAPVTIPEASQPAPGAPAQPQPTAANVQLANQVKILLMQAKGGASPEDVAEMVLNATPEADYQRLYDFINRPTVVNEMVAVNPEVANHREFFDKLRACILADLGPEETPPAQPAG